MADPVRDFLQDANGDLAVVNGDFALVAGGPAVPQGIGIRCRMFKGEVWVDEDIGVPWIEDILVKNPNALVVRADLATAIANTPDVTNVVGAQLQLDAGTRVGTIAYTVQTAYSPNPVTGTTPSSSAT